MQAASNIGGLWVSYDVSLCKPVISDSLAINYDQYVATGVAVGSTNIFAAAVNQSTTNPIVTTVTNNTISFPATVASGVYRVQLYTYGLGVASVETTSIGTFVNCAGNGTYNGFTSTTLRSSATASSTSDFWQEIDLRISGATASFNVGTTFTGTTATMMLRITYIGI